MLVSTFLSSNKIKDKSSHLQTKATLLTVKTNLAFGYLSVREVIEGDQHVQGWTALLR